MFLTEMFGKGAWAPDISPGDTVDTPMGRGVIIDARQNRDGYYVFFSVEHLDQPHDGEVSDFHIDEIRLVSKASVTPVTHGAVKYLDDTGNIPGQHFDDKA